jgi:signal transduction histidine kinase/CheY-like chemotaxis protein
MPVMIDQEDACGPQRRVDMRSILREHFLFGRLAPQHIDRLSSCIALKSVGRGTSIFSKGDAGSFLFAIREGTVKISVRSVDGHDAVFNLLGSGAIFGEIALLDGRPRTADATAMTDCELFVIERRDFLPLMHQDSEFALKLIEILCGLLRHQSKQSEDVMFLNMEIRDKSRQVAEASEHKSRFLAAASHDLRQPMHALGLFVAQLRSHMTSAEGSHLVDRIDDAVTGMNELFNALLDITKLDAGALTPTIAEFPVAELLRRIGGTFAAVAQEKGLSLRLVSSSAWARSDPVLLERIVLNLVSNAVGYTNVGGIVVGCRHRGAKLRIEVADSGPGIPEDQRREIFREFYRLADAAKANQAGLGLGLAIVERLCTLLDHPIELASTPGKGSRFSVTVPTAPAAALPKSHPSQPPAIDVARGKLVVVIDNDALVLEGMGGLLRNWGFRVVTAATPEAALTEVSHIGHEARPDLVISDYHLADGQTGITAIAKLRKAYGAIPAFVISGDTAPERLREAQESGHHLLHKPVQSMTLRAMVSRFLKSVHG